jgi:putative multiple sugar transport system ATP-binding protein
MDTSYILEFSHITKALPKAVALDDVSFQVAAGSIHGLVGDTGSGRHTLMKILAGLYPAGTYEGQIECSAYEGAARCDPLWHRSGAAQGRRV